VTEALVTIGIPTYNRPELLARALGAVANQTYPNIEVIVGDNGAPSDPVSLVVETHRRLLPSLRYVRHGENIGPIRNFMFLLSAAQGHYFMWLADDDEISTNYVASLVAILESDGEASCAVGHWMLMNDERDGRLVPTSSYGQRSALARALRFIWRSDDAFFYALHRTSVLRKASFRGYSWPNRHVLLNWAYVYLLDVVLGGRVLLSGDSSVQFINHDYTAKTYAITRRPLAELVPRAFRRINVHVLYWEKCANQLSPVVMPIIVVTSILSLTREGGSTAVRRIMRLARRERTRRRHR
jgi:GT2 family glycosyltransferase